jgi:prepilin-type N-terminal cleavage/methylation domain-containing protein
VGTGFADRKEILKHFFRRSKMKKRKGFTLIELMVVILIVSILAAVAIPIMRGRIDSAKWSEGKSMMGTIGTAIRAYCAENDASPGIGTFGTTYDAKLGFASTDLDGTYFKAGMFSVTVCTYDPNSLTPLAFTISATNSTLVPPTVTLNAAGTWTP